MPNIPPKANRIWKSCFSPFVYQGRNVIERMFPPQRLQPHRDPLQPLARNFLGALYHPAAVNYWL